MVVFGAEFNGCLNAAIYLIKHHEFAESSKKFLWSMIGKKTNHSQVMMATTMVMSPKTITTSRIRSVT
uniref:Uncharacterized protein n=1 Tax=Acrobeloides nanus TaxID=290746 RepID=A0A914E462_9BILA